MSGKERIIPEEMAFVIIYDADGETFFLQQKDCTYWREPFRHKYNFFGTGLIPPRREQPFDALKRKLVKEMPNVAKKVTNAVRPWKKFHLPWGASLEGEYTCHVYVMMTKNKYEMIDLVNDAGNAGIKRGSLAHISADRVRQMVAHKDFMGSLHVVAAEFLKKAGTNADLFWDQL